MTHRTYDSDSLLTRPRTFEHSFALPSCPGRPKSFGRQYQGWGRACKSSTEVLADNTNGGVVLAKAAPKFWPTVGPATQYCHDYGLIQAELNLPEPCSTAY